MILGQELLAGSYAPSQLDLDLRETEILKLKGYISQSVVLRRSIRFREFYSIPYIFSGFLKSRFPHCKIDKIWIFPEFGQMPLEGPLTATVNGKVVLDALIWCLAVSGVDFV